MAACSKGGSCDPVYQSETATSVTHVCRKCGTVYTRPKGSSARGDLACLLVSIAILAAALTPIWLAARVQP